jgi:hypothetical protein
MRSFSLKPGSLRRIRIPVIKTPAFRVSMYDAPFCLPCRVPLPTTCRLQAVKDWIDQAIARFEAEQKLPSADTNTGHGVDAADTEIDRDLRAEIESLVLQKQELEAEKRELASEKENINKLGGLIESEACRRLFNHEKRGRGKSKRKGQGRDDDDGEEEDDVQVPIVVHARMHVPVTPVVAGGGR